MQEVNAGAKFNYNSPYDAKEIRNRTSEGIKYDKL